MTLKEVGIDFKRIPLPEYVVEITPDSFTPEIKKGNPKALIHDIKGIKAHTHPFRKTLGDDFESYVKRQAGTRMNIVVDKASDLLWLDYKEHGDIIEDITIYVEPYSKGTIVFDYHNEVSTVHHGLTKIIVDEGAELNIIKIQNNSLQGQFIDHTQSEIHDRGVLNVIDVQMGSENMIINYDANLLGYQSHCDYKSIYLAADKRGLDLSFTVNHVGKKSTSDILGKGVLGGQSKKVFRGTLHFERGAVQSAGKEEEFVLLLSDKVKADSIPALMCTEDDVIGEHGASIGQLDENRLFYLMSRGLSETEAKLMVIQSNFREIIENIEDEDVRTWSLDAIDRSIENVV